MANEASIHYSMQIIQGNLKFVPGGVSFTGDVTGTAGPVPGAVLATTAGLDVSFTGLTTPAYCRITNIDGTNFVEYGIWDGATFHELGELLAGESYPLRLSRNMTGFRLKANTASVWTIVEAFEA